MLVIDSKRLFSGTVFLLSFLVVLWFIFEPLGVFGNRNMLNWADDLFNRLSKGSSYFIPDMQKVAKNYQGEVIEVVYPIKVKLVKMEKAELIMALNTIVPAAGGTVTVVGNQVALKADLGKLLAQVNRDSDLMYKNDGKAISIAYNLDAKQVIGAWWELLSQAVVPMQAKGLRAEAKAIDKVVKKSIEPAFNYYSIQAESIGSKWSVVVCLLVFYVIYTLWLGFAIFQLFSSFGLSASKAKVKGEEV